MFLPSAYGVGVGFSRHEEGGKGGNADQEARHLRSVTILRGFRGFGEWFPKGSEGENGVAEICLRVDLIC